MAYKKDALLDLGTVDPTKFINPIGMVNPNRVAEIPAASNTGNPTTRPVFDDITQGAANYIYGSQMDKQKSMSNLSSAPINPAPLVKTGDVDLNSWAHKIERKNELRKKHEKLKKEL
tara:strand:+ start:31 stop:381 length:351 start_codon:yes stop_codon:yes gene_type:complete